MEKQFPVHDIEPEKCHDLPPEELKSMQEYVGHVKRDVAGLGIIHEVNKPHEEYIDEYLPPPPPELLQEFGDNDPIYVNVARKGRTSFNRALPNTGIDPKENLHHARPYNIIENEDLNEKTKKLGIRVDSFSSSSSDTSNASANNNNTSLKPKSSQRGEWSNVKNGNGLSSDGGRNLLQEAMKHPTIPAGQKCENCKDDLKTGEVAISAERAGPVKLWHPRCFKCHDCKVSIAVYLKIWVKYTLFKPKHPP